MDGAELAAWIAAGLGAIAIVVAIVIALRQRTRKELSFEAYTEFPLFAGGPLNKQIEISANGQRLRVPHLLLVTITNTGNAAIRPEDFYEPLGIELRDASIVAVHMEPTPGVSPDASIQSPQSLQVEPLLLNVGEGFVCYGLVDGCPHGVQVTARIADAEIRDVSRASVSQSLLEGAVEVSLGAVAAMVPLVGPAVTAAIGRSRRVRASNTVAPRHDRH